MLKVLTQGVIATAEKYIHDYICKTDEKYPFRYFSSVFIEIDFVEIEVELHYRYKTKEDEEHFMQTIINSLKDFNCDTAEMIAIDLPSKNEEVMNLLGCTVSCPICNALCWQSCGHDVENSNDFFAKLHQSCHQPAGLGCTIDHDTSKFVWQACHTYEDSHMWYCNDVKIPWSDIKKKYHKWSFYSHHNVEFQKIMDWFMSKLHEDLEEKASSWETKTYKPAILTNLDKMVLKIKEIIVAIRLRIFENFRMT